MVSVRRSGPPFALLALACTAAACSADPLTEIVVVADTDLAVPGEIDAIRFRVHGDPDRTEEAVARIGDGAPRPVTLGLVSESGQGTLEVIAIGEREGVEVLRRTARVSFQEGRVVALRMDLLRSCLTASCGAERTCGEAGCRDVEVAPSELIEWSGEPPGLDAGAADAGDSGPPRDGGDAAMGDAGRDSGPTDAGPPADCERAADCDDGVPCTVDDCTAGGTCTNVPDASSCTDSVACTTAVCDPVAGCMQMPDDGACDDGIGCTVGSCDPLAGCRSTPVHSSCASGSYCDPLGDCTVAPTFTDVYTTVFAGRCGPCHTTSGSPGGGLSMATQTLAYVVMVGVAAECGTGNERVVARDSARSLLWRKVSAVDLCGDVMPRMSMTLSAAQIALIARWIDGGALDL